MAETLSLHLGEQNKVWKLTPDKRRLEEGAFVRGVSWQRFVTEQEFHVLSGAYPYMKATWVSLIGSRHERYKYLQ